MGIGQRSTENMVTRSRTKQLLERFGEDEKAFRAALTAELRDPPPETQPRPGGQDGRAEKQQILSVVLGL